MTKHYARHFSGTVDVLDKPIRLQFGKIGKHLEPGFVVTSIKDDIGFLLKGDKKKFRITHSNFFIDNMEKKKLETAINAIIRTNGLRLAA
jgi:hypothetical protein